MIILLGLGLIIVLLLVLIGRVSALTKKIEEISEKLNPPKPVPGPAGHASAQVKKPTPAEKGSQEVPGAVIAAIGAAVKQYSAENK